MNSLKIAAILLIVFGVLSLSYRGFSYTKETHRADIGAMHFEINKKQHVDIPLWLALAAVIGGAALLVSNRKA